MTGPAAVPDLDADAPAATASSSTAAARSGACSGTLAIQRRRSARAAANSASPALTTRAIASPSSASTW